MKKSMKTIVRVLKRDYEYNTEELVFETEITNVMSIMAAASNSGDGRLIIVTVGGEQIFKDDECTVHHIEFCKR